MTEYCICRFNCLQMFHLIYNLKSKDIRYTVYNMYDTFEKMQPAKKDQLIIAAVNNSELRILIGKYCKYEKPRRSKSTLSVLWFCGVSFFCFFYLQQNFVWQFLAVTNFHINATPSPGTAATVRYCLQLQQLWDTNWWLMLTDGNYISLHQFFHCEGSIGQQWPNIINSLPKQRAQVQHAIWTKHTILLQ